MVEMQSIILNLKILIDDDQLKFIWNKKIFKLIINN